MNIQIDKEHRAECVGGMGCPCPQRASHSAGISVCSATGKHILIPSLWVLMEAVLCRHVWLHPWPLVINSTFRSFLLPEGWGLSWESQLFNHVWSFEWPVVILKLSRGSQTLVLREHKVDPSHSGELKDFLEWEWKNFVPQFCPCGNIPYCTYVNLHGI